MSETIPREKTDTTTYDALAQTALSFITAQSHTPHLPTAIDYPTLRATTTRTYTHTFGPQYSISQTPHLQGVFSFDDFQRHLEGMTAGLQRWDVEVGSLTVDQRARRVVVGVVYGMVVRGSEEVVGSEVVWVLELEEEGGVWRVGRSREVVDFAAGKRLREIMGGVK